MAPFDIRWRLLVIVGTHMKTTPKAKRLVGSRKAVFANVSTGTHARVVRHAPATGLSAAKYAATAIEFYLDLEDAFGGPLTEQFRKMTLRHAALTAEKIKTLYS